MAEPAQTTLAMRYSLRTMLIVVTLVALGCAFLPAWLDNNPHSLKFCVAAILVTGSVAGAAYVLGGFGATIVQPALRWRGLRVGCWFLFVLAMAFALYTSWAWHRWINLVDYLMNDPQYPRSLPFPDEIVRAYEHWLDVRNPAPPGSFKIEGEYYEVIPHLEYAILLSVIGAFFVLGVIAPGLPARMRSRFMRSLQRGNRVVGG